MLKGQGHLPWLYEFDAKCYRRSGLTDEEKIINELARCDLVVALYKTRAGSRMKEEPWFYGTDFELFHGLRLGKPVHLYVVGARYSTQLRGLLGLYAQELILKHRNMVPH